MNMHATGHECHSSLNESEADYKIINQGWLRMIDIAVPYAWKKLSSRSLSPERRLNSRLIQALSLIAARTRRDAC
jgi:hypothetical protein